MVDGVAFCLVQPESEAPEVTNNRQKRMAFAVTVLLGTLLLAGSVSVRAQDSDTSSVGAGVFSQDYRIGVSDVLSISVWNQEALRATMPVRPDGRITVPLLGEIEAAGRTPAEVQAELAIGYEKFVTAPAVSLVITEINSRRVFVLGEVQEPGVFDILTPTTLLQALAMAGSFTEFAKKDEVVVVRHEGGASQRFVVSVKAITSGKNPADNLLLLPGDTIYVP